MVLDMISPNKKKIRRKIVNVAALEASVCQSVSLKRLYLFVTFSFSPIFFPVCKVDLNGICVGVGGMWKQGIWRNVYSVIECISWLQTLAYTIMIYFYSPPNRWATWEIDGCSFRHLNAIVRWLFEDCLVSVVCLYQSAHGTKFSDRMELLN